MLSVVKKSRAIPDSPLGKIPAAGVEANTPEWRDRVNDELDLKISSGHLAETLGPDEKPGVQRFTRYRREIDEYLWPPLMPLAADTGEVRYLLDGLADADKDLLRLIRDMNREEQRKLAEMLILMRRPK